MTIRQPKLTTGGTLLAALLIFTAYTAAQTPTLTTIYSFQGAPGDGQQPGGVVPGGGGMLYGFASGGASNNGVVFSLTPPASPGAAWTETVLHNFNGGSSDGSGPLAIAVGGGGVLYGITGGGGTAGGGTAFSLTPPASRGGPWSEALLYSFPSRLLLNPGLAIDGHGVLYGTTFQGGTGTCPFPATGCGTVYSLAPPASSGGAWAESVLYSFMDNGSDGFYPLAGVVIGSGGVLYGTTGGGSAYGGGTAFSLTPPVSAGGAWTENVLVSLRWGGPSLGFEPDSGLAIGGGGTLYGTTKQGGNYGCPDVEAVGGCGAVFELVPPASPGGAWNSRLIYDFYPVCCGDAYWPTSAVVGSGGVLYGATYEGGSGNLGAVYSLTPPASPGGAWTEAVVHSFTGIPPDGALTGGLVVGIGAIYGVTAEGGTPNNYGTVFSLQP